MSTNNLPPTDKWEDHLTNSNVEAFKELVGNAFNEDLFRQGGNWEDYEACMEEHWDDLLDILKQEIYERAADWIEQKAKAVDEPHPSLSAAERNPNLR